MRAGFEVYRAFDQDARDNREALERNGKLDVPVLALGGEISTTGPLMEEMVREVATDVTGEIMPGHRALARRGEPRGVRGRGAAVHRPGVSSSCLRFSGVAGAS